MGGKRGLKLQLVVVVVECRTGSDCNSRHSNCKLRREKIIMKTQS